MAENKKSTTVSINQSEYTDDVAIEAGQIVFVSWDDENAAEERSEVLSKHGKLKNSQNILKQKLNNCIHKN